MQLLIAILLGLIPAYIAQKKGRRGWLYFVLSLFTSPIIMIIVSLCVSDLTKLQIGDGDIIDDDPNAQYQENMYGESTDNFGAGENLLTDEQMMEAEDAVYTEMPAYETAAAENVPTERVEVCPYCGSPVKENAKFCENCGAPLQR